MGISKHLFDGMQRLLAAVLISFCLLVSQMAHAEAPSLADTATEMSSTSKAAHDTGHVHASEDPSTPDDHDGTGFDVKCASHCPSAFVFADVDSLRRDWMLSGGAVQIVEDLDGLTLPTADRPPRI